MSCKLKLDNLVGILTLALARISGGMILSGPKDCLGSTNDASWSFTRQSWAARFVV